MQPTSFLFEGRPLDPGRGRQGPLSSRCGPPGQALEPLREHMNVVKDPDRVLQPLPGRAGLGFTPAHRLVHLGGVPETSDAPPKSVEGLGVVVPAHGREALEKRGPLALADASGSLEDHRAPCGTPGADVAEVLAKAVDVQVQDAVGQPAAAPGPRHPETSQELSLLGRGRLVRGETLFEEAHQHIEVPSRARRTRELAQDPPGSLQAPPPLLPGQQRQSHTKLAAGHPYLVDGLLLPGEGPGELSKQPPHPLPQERRGPLIRGWG